MSVPYAVARPSAPGPHPGGPPVAPADPERLLAHGDIRPDPWFWLRNREDPAVVAYLEAENAWTAAQMKSTEGLQERLYREMLGRVQETDLSVPERVDAWWYYARTEEGRQYPIHCRRHLSPEGPEEVLLDQNELAAGHAYFRLGAFRPSPDHRRLAYAVDTSGDERYTLVVRDLETGALLPDRVQEVTYGVEWSADGRSLFYLTMDAASRPWRLHRHEMGSLRRDEMIYQEDDGTFILSLGKTRSRRLLLLDSASHSSSEVRLLDAERPRDPPRLLVPREPNVEYAVEHHDERLFILTNDGAVNFRLVEAPVESPGRESWTSVVAHRAAVKLDGADAFRHHLVVYEREAATPQIRIRDLRTGEEHRIAFPEAVYSVEPTRNPEFDTTVLRFMYTSPVTPLSVIDYDMETRAWTLQKRQPVIGYDETLYRAERDFASAPDGSRIPISLVYREPLELDGTRPL